MQRVKMWSVETCRSGRNEVHWFVSSLIATRFAAEGEKVKEHSFGKATAEKKLEDLRANAPECLHIERYTIDMLCGNLPENPFPANRR